MAFPNGLSTSEGLKFSRESWFNVGNRFMDGFLNASSSSAISDIGWSGYRTNDKKVGPLKHKDPTSKGAHSIKTKFANVTGQIN
jgi:hypothetical protein